MQDIKSKVHLKKVILDRLQQTGYLVDPDRIEIAQVTSGKPIVFFTSDRDNKIHTTNADVPTYYCINEDHIESIVKDITEELLEF